MLEPLFAGLTNEGYGIALSTSRATAAGAVNKGEDDAQPAQSAQRLRAVQYPLAQRLLQGAEPLRAYSGQGALGVGRREPGPLLRHADRHRLEALGVQRRHHRLGGDDGHLVLRGAAAEQDDDLEA